MTPIRFSVPAIPVAQPRQRHRVAVANGRAFARNYTPGKHPVNAFKASVRHEFVVAYQGPPLDGPLRLAVLFVMPRPGRLVWKTRPMPRAWAEPKPDTDNLVKAVKDSLNGLAWRDDSQVCLLNAAKVYASGDEAPHVEVVIARLDGEILEVWQ